MLVSFIQIAHFGMFISIVSAGMPYGPGIFAVTTNCSADTQPCGPAPSCCPVGLECQDRYGIPLCLNPVEFSDGGFDHIPCADPYLFVCNVGIPGFCCPIGTTCLTLTGGNSKAMLCVNAFGTTASAIPSATTDLVPSATPILGGNANIIYSPSDAWNVSDSVSNCTASTSLYVTDIINATISFNYSGPSIMVRTVSSSNGGVFTVFVDGFNTTSTIDTYSGPGDLSLPVCYPLEFPPFVVTPPGYPNRTQHTLNLIYTGPSTLSPKGTNSSIIQFDSFAIPDIQSLTTTSNYGFPGPQNLNVYASSALLALSFYNLI